MVLLNNVILTLSFSRRTELNKARLTLFPDDIVMRLLIEIQELGHTEISRELLMKAVYSLSLRLPAIAKMFRFRVDPFGKISQPFDQAISNLTNSQLISVSLLGATEMITIRIVDYTTKLPKGMVDEIKYTAMFVKAVTK